MMSKHVYSDGEYLLRLHVGKLPEGKYLATSDDLPDLLAQGSTLDETIDYARDLARKLLESYREHGESLPLTLRAATKHVEVDTVFAL
jgi:predicted RNase H-like HicB family nuclease